MALSLPIAKDLIARYADLLVEHGSAFEGAELVTPTGEHFPDHWGRDLPSVERLLARVASYTPLGEDVPLSVVLAEDPSDDGHCTSGCSKPGARVDGVERRGDGYRVVVPVGETAHPTRLVCALARGVSAAVAVEAGFDAEVDIGVASEVVATASGFGVVLLEGAHVYTKSCGGPSIHAGTALSPAELALLLALFCKVNRVAPRVARRHLGATQLEAFAGALALLDDNGELVEKLRGAPELVASGLFDVAATPGMLARLSESAG